MNWNRNGDWSFGLSVTKTRKAEGVFVLTIIVLFFLVELEFTKR